MMVGNSQQLADCMILVDIVPRIMMIIWFSMFENATNIENNQNFTILPFDNQTCQLNIKHF